MRPSLLRHPTRAAQAFLRDQTGAAVVETMLWLPVLIFAWLAVFGFWDTYRDRATVQKATFAVADILSREMVPVTNGYLDTLGLMVDRLTAQGMAVSKSFAAYRRNSDGTVTLIWSYAPANNGTALSQSDLTAMAANLPAIKANTTAILVKSAATYNSTLRAPLNDLVFSGTVNSTVVLQPRYLTAICRNTSPC